MRLKFRVLHSDAFFRHSECIIKLYNLIDVSLCITIITLVLLKFMHHAIYLYISDIFYVCS